MLGGLPGLALDRTGVALLGAIALVATGRVGLEEARDAIDVPTLALLFGLMVVSAQLRLGGFYARVTRGLAELALGAAAACWRLLVRSRARLSSVLANDIVCLAAAPVLVEGCARRELDPRPFLLGLAAAANVGSAATLIGNPQNMLIGETLRLSFTGYALVAAVPAVLGLLVVWGVLCRLFRSRWQRPTPSRAPIRRPSTRAARSRGCRCWPGSWRSSSRARGRGRWSRWPAPASCSSPAARPRARCCGWSTGSSWCSSSSLFVVQHALVASGTAASAVEALRSRGVAIEQPAWLFAATALLSNLVSNVPAAMLLLPVAGPSSGPLLALSSTLAGNLLLVGSIANLIVADRAARLGVRISWREHARAGIPITLATLAIAAAWLALGAAD